MIAHSLVPPQPFNLTSSSSSASSPFTLLIFSSLQLIRPPTHISLFPTLTQPSLFLPSPSFPLPFSSVQSASSSIRPFSLLVFPFPLLSSPFFPFLFHFPFHFLPSFHLPSTVSRSSFPFPLSFTSSFTPPLPLPFPPSRQSCTVFRLPQVSTGAGQASHLVRLAVVSPRAVIPGRGTRHVQVGSTISLTCLIEQVSRRDQSLPVCWIVVRL